LITPEEILQQAQWVVWCGLAIGLVLGAVSQATRFCTLGAVADWVGAGDRSRMRMWVLAMVTALLSTQLLIAVTGFESQQTVYTSSRLMWLSNILGGAVFGFGMTLASGCGARTLVRIGEGSLKAIVVFLVMAVAAFMTMRGLTGVWRVNTIEKVQLGLPTSQDLPSLLAHGFGVPAQQIQLLVILSVALLMLLFVLRGRLHQQPMRLVGGLVIGGLVTAGWWATAVLGFVAEHPETLEKAFLATNSKSPESLTFVGPLAYSLELLIYWSDRNQIFSFAVATVLGVILGSAGSALARGRFKWEAFKNTQDMANHLVGALLMGIGGVVAMGCTMGHGLSGISLLSLGSFITTLSIIGGAALGLRWLSR
jgi:uncharacterized membrane protein YedE/YeeE